ncbi:MAG: hypothetical protein K2X82_26610 [Gemmataceae bacterium]|nr:hypothetical protein [Gemmataceae bacterium]
MSAPAVLLLVSAFGQVGPVGEIDCSRLPPAGAVPSGYAFTLTLKFASGVEAGGDTPYRVTRDGGPDDVADMISASLGGGKWATRQVGQSVFVFGYDGSRLTELTAAGDGPKPTIKWWLASKPKKK